MRLSKLFQTLNQRIADARIKHVQLLLRTKDGKRIAKFVSCDNDHYKETIKLICKDFPESMAFLEETPTTISYLV